MIKPLGLIAVTALLLAGCSSSYGIKILDGMPQEVYLTFSKGTDVKVGDSFVLYHLQQALSGPSVAGGHAGHGGGSLNLRHEAARVQVVRLADETHALVKVLSGTVEEGLKVEKTNEAAW